MTTNDETRMDDISKPNEISHPANSEKLPFFVYGTLRTGEGNWEHYLKGCTTRQLPAVLLKHRLYAQTYPFVFDADDDSRVIGDLAFVKAEKYVEVLQNLDYLEDYDSETHSGWYLRQVREVEYTDEAGNLQRVMAWVYHGGPEVEAGIDQSRRIESGDWLAVEDRVRE